MARHQLVIGGGLAGLTLVLGSLLMLEDSLMAPVGRGEPAARMGDMFVYSVTDGSQRGYAPKVGDTKVTPTVSPIVSPMSPSVSPILSPKPLESQEPMQSAMPQISPAVPLTPSPRATPGTSSSVSPSPYPTPTPTPLQQLLPIVISEVAWMGTGASSADEWIELYNPNTESVSLEGWTIRSEVPGVPSALLTGKSLAGKMPGKGFYILERSDDTSLSIAANWAEPFGGNGLNNQGEKLVLLDGRGQLHDTVGGDGAWYAGDAVTKASMERINPGAPGNNAQNWRTSTHLSQVLDKAGNRIMGTPGFRE